MAEWELLPTRLFFSAKAWETVPETLRDSFQVVRASDLGAGEAVPCLFVFASEILVHAPENLPEWLSGSETRYGVLRGDVPTAELPRISTALSLHKPDQRMHLTEDVSVVGRAVVSLLRDHPIEAILDAWMFDDRLTLLLADLGKRSLDPARIPVLRKMKPGELAGFRIDEDGSYLHWPEADIHLGVSQILQAVDPEYLAQVEIERNALDYTPWALEAWRREAGLRQVDIEGMSERHVRRIEQGVSRLTVSAAEHFANAFGITTREFLDELGRRTRETREKVERAKEPVEEIEREVVVVDVAA